MTHPLTILGIESSCDETAAAVIHDGKIVSNVVMSQLIHQQYGGVVPELAARAHETNIIPVVTAALKEAAMEKEQLHAIGFTQGPGLLGPLLVGSCFAKSLAFSLGIPLIGVHHIQAHVLANFIDDPKPHFPFLCLTVSGGHTQIILVKDYFSMEVLGETQDDAAGEAFDKIAHLMGLGYPGGALIDRYAQEEGNPQAFAFPATHMPHFDFSFSGIKTVFSLFIRSKTPAFIQANRADIAASIQAVLVHMLLDKLTKAAQKSGIGTIALAGGVAANSYLRQQLKALAAQHHWTIFVPAIAYCTDNAAMVAITAYYKHQLKAFTGLDAKSLPRYPLRA
ncbi:MAG: tRNA (adenosine(37)-N6)-threonylcarbamoyltransferase complex transferase subunit TsaD [Candidatus Cardinium sp.]|uniref:tRNA (adenosine(37)-N6)-threonylcarbamoyltransferase complex transferase subunit TsaD n=1 Tax=Cardinium endosymbiont of Dermatophagoides farinae TaxID=2597823 RepID=UPI001182836D|nr:tRNA (adenosine(37)-N6)-threonylcarbamoyltransferase complex transferase subunit TsaD [Cardinium endosymbiont of Dermatophagoides farinae]TSJ81167.1 tRNA (adenosine(37)-N6)-threonylcarbamoyltransferase complex transferase subunit TsaD [Cardinium endosymbiont of Dermatophagoides farinae]UWW97214.1 MAG: tRNA (adenosine(37)-N6)-threonylcarbamoyltransferase complex transferase subunit TsaD [Candidatus Cardinium sp.]